MATGSDLVFDNEQASDHTPSSVRARRILVGTGALLLLIIVIAFQLVSEPTTEQGRQATPIESVVLDQPAVEGWEPLVPAAGELRSGFPAPMVWRDERVCIGFARVDFGPDDFRPSLARCVPNRDGSLAADEIRFLLSVKSGFDTWHFVEAATPIDSMQVLLATGERMNADRVHLSGSTGALRLENGRDLASVEWSTFSSTYRCVPDPAAWQTSVFCTTSGDATD